MSDVYPDAVVDATTQVTTHGEVAPAAMSAHPPGSARPGVTSTGAGSDDHASWSARAAYRLALLVLVMTSLMACIYLAGLTAGDGDPPALRPSQAPDATSPSAPPAASVTIFNFGFDANAITVNPGDTVAFTNTGDRPHTITDRGGTFDTQPIDTGDTAAVTFNVPGTYFYFCRINPERMNGTVTVEATGEEEVFRIQAIDDGNITDEQLRFDPPELDVPVGSTLIVANVGGSPHSLTADDGSFSTGIIEPGPENGRFAGSNTAIRVDNPGTFGFYCEIHGDAMRGTLTVRERQRSAPETATVEMLDFAFREPQTSVASSGEVTFENQGREAHNATLDARPGAPPDEDPDTGPIVPGASGRLVAPAQPGSYSYRCAIHPDRMHGVLVVLGADTPAPGLVTTTVPVAAAEPAGDGGEATSPTTIPPSTTEPSTTTTLADGDSSGSGGIPLWAVIGIGVVAFLSGFGITRLLRGRPDVAATPDAGVDRPSRSVF